MKMMEFKESHAFTVTAATSTDKKGSDWDVVLIETGLSKNGNFYPATTLKASAPLFEGLKACAYRFGGRARLFPFSDFPIHGIAES